MNKDFDYIAFNAFRKTPKYWGLFDAANSQHKYVLSLLRQLDWVAFNKKTGRALADVERFGTWLQSAKSPVKKPLKKMKPEEVSTIISALENMVKKKYSQ